MKYSETIWNGYRCLEFEFQNRHAKLVCPKHADVRKRWILKTEYFGAFPKFEIEMLEKGFHVAYVQNKTRWHDESDDSRKEELCRLLHVEFGLNDKCFLVGMSCGGMHAVYFAAKYPNRIAGIYLDAPVMNLLSCPAGVGSAGNDMYEEFVHDTGITILELINYRHHPIDEVDKLVSNHLPVFLVAGDSDDVVPYAENGKHLYEFYHNHGGDITLVIKPGAGHHPHGLDDNQMLMEFINRVY